VAPGVLCRDRDGGVALSRALFHIN
jgi:hypothetical protein